MVRDLLRLLHLSPKEGLKVLDPKFAGTGTVVHGAERARGVKAIHYWMPGRGKLEHAFRNPLLTRYEVDVPEDVIYDLQRDPFGLMKYLDPGNGRWPDERGFRRALLGEGFEGFRAGRRGPGQREAVVLYTPQRPILNPDNRGF